MRVADFQMKTAALAVLLLSSAGFAAHAQDRVDLYEDTREVLDQGVSDIGPLGTSLRQIDPGLHQPGSFERVERVPGHDDLLMRVAGGLYAVFPQSQYAATAEGLLPVVPNNTIFYIGKPDFLTHDVSPRSLDELMGIRDRVNGSALHTKMARDDAAHHPHMNTGEISGRNRSHGDARNGRDLEDDTLRPATIAEDTGYRRHRLMELMHRAGRAAADGDNAR